MLTLRSFQESNLLNAIFCIILRVVNKKNFAFLSRKLFFEHYILHYIACGEGKYLTFSSLQKSNTLNNIRFTILSAASEKFWTFHAREPASPGSRTNKKYATRPPQGTLCVNFLFTLVCFHTHSHFLQSISRSALNGTPTKLQ